MVLWSYGFMVFNSSSGGLRVPGRRYSVVGRPTGPLDDGADSDGQPCGARSRRSRAMAATGAGAWIHGLMVLWFHGSCRDEEHEEQPPGAPAPARRRGATARDADSAPWLPLAPARSATRSSLRAPRSEDAVRAAFERSRGEGAARAACSGAPAGPPSRAHYGSFLMVHFTGTSMAQRGAASGRPGARTRSERPSSAPAEKVRRELPSGAPAGPPSRAHYGSFQFHFGRERRPAPMPVSAAPPKPRQDVNGPGGPGRPCRDATPRTVPDEARASGEGHVWLGKYRLRTLNPRPRTLNHRKSLADSGPAPGQA